MMITRYVQRQVKEGEVYTTQQNIISKCIICDVASRTADTF
jgi:hypothetical protein